MTCFRTAAAALALLILAARPAPAEDSAMLVEGSAIVTGTRPETRHEALTRALRDVLVKRSGNPALARDPRVDALDPDAMVESYLYLDRMSDLPKHDEQGTRDRPYTLIARFSATKLDAALAVLGDKPWLALRPKLLARIRITDRLGGGFPLTADGGNDERHRQALLAAASRYGMTLVLPTSDGPDLAMPDALVVTGTLTWDDTKPGWTGDWRVAGDRVWGIKGVSFDEAYRDLVRGAIAIASGHGLPAP